MKTIRTLSLLTIILLASCKDFDELQFDPNRATQTHPNLILTNIEVSTFNVISISSALASRMVVYTDGAADEQYYGWQRAGFGQYGILRQTIKMEEEAERLGLENYKHLATFFKCYHIIELSKTFGDIPYRDALTGYSKGNFKPVYDRQEDIYLDVLDKLKEASTLLDPAKGAISGDVIYGGSITKWKKLINSFYLRLLISLSNKTGNSKLNVIGRFNEVINNPTQYPLISSNGDNAALNFYDLVGNRYTFYNNNSLKTAYYMDESFVNLLKAKEDPRLFIFADKEPQGSGLPENDFNAYGGLGGSDALADNTTRLSNGEGSPIDSRYHSNPTNEPSVLLGYAETEFNLAEAAARGWISQDTKTHYEKGIKASMGFYGISTAEQDQYILHPEVVYTSANGIEMILTQKYINYFMNGGWEQYHNHLRTGYPAFDVEGGGILNNGKVPKRWMYPENELQLNGEHVTEAIQRQFPGGDDVNGTLWLHQQE